MSEKTVFVIREINADITHDYDDLVGQYIRLGSDSAEAMKLAENKIRRTTAGTIVKKVIDDYNERTAQVLQFENRSAAQRAASAEAIKRTLSPKPAAKEGIVVKTITVGDRKMTCLHK